MTTQLDNPQPPRLPDHPPAYSSGVMMTFNNVLRLYFNRLANLLNALVGPDGGVYLQNPHAMLMSDQDQANPSITGANQLIFDQEVIVQGIEVRNTDEVWFEKTGQYLVTFRLQVSNRSNAVQEFEVWAGYDGTNYPLSNSRVDVPARKDAATWGHAVVAVSGIFTVQNPDTEYLTIKWWASSTDVFLEHYPAGTTPARPEIPSVIMTINFVSRLP
jgi:hypothetical protein